MSDALTIKNNTKQTLKALRGVVKNAMHIRNKTLNT
jgi:hypothetical protein